MGAAAQSRLLDPAAERPPRARAVIFAVIMTVVLLVVFVDYITGTQLRVFPLYFIPIAAGSYLLSTRVGIAISVISGAGWLTSNWLAGEDKPGTLIWVLNTITMTVSFLTVNFLISALKLSILRERNASREDLLTGLANSRAFHEAAELLLQGARRSGRPLTLAYMDLDNFKSVNDTCGHAEGDQVLRVVGTVLKHSFRKSDLVARVGGDEFVVYLPDAGEDSARVALDHARANLLQAMAEHKWPVTVSVGAVTFSAPAVTLKEAMHCADELMYAVKALGKNRVHTRTVGPDLKPLPRPAD